MFNFALADIDTIMFDMDGTLLDLAFDNYFWQTGVMQHWAELNNTSIATARATLLPQLNSLSGTLQWYSIPFWSDKLGLDVAALKAQLAHMISLRQGTIDLLMYLTAQHKKLWLVTNAHPIALHIKLEKTGIAPYFSHIISSAALNEPKESLLFWQALQRQTPFNPDTTLFIDDNEQVLDTAKLFGIRHLLCITQPDSTQPARTQLRHSAMNQLHDLKKNYYLTFKKHHI